MSEPQCGDQANELLPWYLNGTLDEHEERRVRDHLDDCAICSAELDDLTAIARGLEASAADEGPAPSVAAVERAPRRAPWLIAAVLALPALIGVYWALLGFPRERPTPAPPVEISSRFMPTALLDLGGGPTRSEGSTPVVVVSPGVERIVTTFRLPIVPDTPIALELQDAAGKVLVREERLLSWDAQLNCVYSFPAEALAGSGEYALVLQDAASKRTFRYQFVVKRVSAS